MFVALRDLRHARGRFALILLVVVLTSVLVTFLSALTAGLGEESTSAVTGLPADRLVFATSEGASPDFMTSRVTAEARQRWTDAPGVARAEPLGVSPMQVESGATTASVTVFGVEPGSDLLPAGAPGLEPGTVVLSSGAAQALPVQPGDSVTVAGQRLSVAGSLPLDRSYAHTPVVWTTLRDWQSLTGASVRSTDASTVLALTTHEISSRTVADLDAVLGTTTVSLRDARSAIGSFSAENGSLVTIQVFLVVISALVVGAFFTVWTISRSGDVAVLKALGASTAYLLRDAVGQAAILLLMGVGVGTGLAAVGATALQGALPVVIAPGTTLLPAAALVVVGLVGAVLAIARITGIDPHAALAAR